MVQDHSRHDRDTSSINDKQRDLETHDGPCAIHELIRLNLNIRILFPLYLDMSLSEIWSSVSWYLVLSRYRQITLTRSHDHTSCDLVTCLQTLMWSHWVGPFSISSAFGCTNPGLDHTPQRAPLEYPTTPLWSPCYGVTVDAIKATSGNSD